MSKIAVITDSNSGVTQSQAKELGLFVVPMPFRIGEEDFYEDINLTQEEFYKKLKSDAKIFTSQPAVGDIMTLWDDLLKEYDYIIHIPYDEFSRPCTLGFSFLEPLDKKIIKRNKKHKEFSDYRI